MKLYELVGARGNAYSGSKRLLCAIKGTVPDGGIIVFPEYAFIDTDRLGSALNKYRIKTGHFLIGGRYTAKNGIHFGKNSLSAEILNVSAEALIEITDKLCSKLEVKSVIIKDCIDRIYLAEIS